jgi:pimeloyl-ACP methyl ester carboxylesterase
MNIRLADRRVLGYAEYGDPHGNPVFFFHGTPGSRCFRPSDVVTTKLGVRLICIERPGYGESTFQANRSILDWPHDVIHVADALGIEKFAVAGHSGGGPYALACAKLLPARVSVAAVISGAGPVDAPNATKGMALTNWFGFKFGQYIPWSIGRVLVWLIYRERCADPARAMDRENGHRPPMDDELIARPEIREVCLLSEREAYRPGITGFAWDVRTITRPWGFALNEMNVPVQLWHGTDDNMTSIHMARYMAETIPNCKFTVYQNEGHLLIFPHWQEILSALTQR